ncbi:NAD(P)/FAD-dependent oxidoreductase [Cohnella cellulosilytica]
MSDNGSRLPELYDVTIVGGGPAGMYAAFYGGMRDMKMKLIEAKSALGGFLHMYPEKMVWDVGGLPPIRCDLLMSWLEQQARTFEPTVVLGQEIRGLIREEDGTFVLVSADGKGHRTKTVIIAAGRGITQIEKLNIQGAERYEVANLHYTIQDLNSFRGKKVLVSGGGNSAVDWAIDLAAVASSVIVVHRREEFSALEKRVSDMQLVAETRTPYAIDCLHGDGNAIRRVTIVHSHTGEKEDIDIDAVLVNHGYNSDYSTFEQWGLEIGERGPVVDERLETSIPGIFAAGDCIVYGTKVRLIAGAFNDAVLAVNGAKLHIEPEAHKMAFVSSHNDLFRDRNRAFLTPGRHFGARLPDGAR